MTILVIAEHNNAELNAATLNTGAAAQAIGGEIEVLVAGAGCGAVAEAASKIAGLSKVLVADNAAYANLLPENVSLLNGDIGNGDTHIRARASANGNNYLRRVV